MNEQLLQGVKAMTDRRAFLRRAGLAGAVASIAPAAAAILAGGPSAKANAPKVMKSATDLDGAILNFALNLEYLEGEYYCYAASGAGLADNGVGTFGAGTQGTVTVKANAEVPWEDPLAEQLANEIAVDELDHVNFLRGVLFETGMTYYAEPNIDILNSFNTLAQAAGIGSSFDPFASELNFFLGAFIFEDVGVTAYGGAASLINSADYLAAASGILAVEAYHAGLVRTRLFGMSQEPDAINKFGIDIVATVAKISALRDQLSGGSADASGNAIAGVSTDQGIVAFNSVNYVPSDSFGVAFRRNTREVLNIVYGAPNATSGLFFPTGMNGLITK